MMPGLVLLLGVLGTWRLARDYVHEEGPMGLYGRSRRALRAWAEAKIEASDVSDPRGHAWYWLYEGVECMVCATFWAALVVAVLVVGSQQPPPNLPLGGGMLPPPSLPQGGGMLPPPNLPGSAELAEHLGGGIANLLLTWFGLAGGALVIERWYMQGMVKHGPF